MLLIFYTCKLVFFLMAPVTPREREREGEVREIERERKRKGLGESMVRREKEDFTG